MKETVHWRVGEGIGERLLEVSQEYILKGDPDHGIQVYTRSLIGCPTEVVIGVLKGALVVESDDTGVTVTDDPEKVKANRGNLWDWDYLMKKSSDDIIDRLKWYQEVMEALDHEWDTDPMTFDIQDHGVNLWGQDDYEDLVIPVSLAKVLSKQSLKGLEKVRWENLTERVETDDGASDKDKLYWMVAQSLGALQEVHSRWIKFSKTYQWLAKNGMIEHVPFIEVTAERVFRVLTEYLDPTKTHNHPVSDEALVDYKTRALKELTGSLWYKEYQESGGLLPKDIIDGYDAGYLSPEGIFYGENGPVSAMIHMNLGDKIVKSLGIITGDSEVWLTGHGWMKTHHQEVYGYFRYYKENKTGDTRSWKPTDAQLEAIYRYVDKHYHGCFYPQPMIISGRMLETRKLRQMDEVAIHEAFLEH